MNTVINNNVDPLKSKRSSQPSDESPNDNSLNNMKGADSPGVVDFKVYTRIALRPEEPPKYKEDIRTLLEGFSDKSKILELLIEYAEKKQDIDTLRTLAEERKKSNEIGKVPSHSIKAEYKKDIRTLLEGFSDKSKILELLIEYAEKKQDIDTLRTLAEERIEFIQATIQVEETTEESKAQIQKALPALTTHSQELKSNDIVAVAEKPRGVPPEFISTIPRDRKVKWLDGQQIDRIYRKIAKTAAGGDSPHLGGNSLLISTCMELNGIQDFEKVSPDQDVHLYNPKEMNMVELERGTNTLIDVMLSGAIRVDEVHITTIEEDK